jgi:hypothetical protein
MLFGLTLDNLILIFREAIGMDRPKYHIEDKDR